MAGAPPFGDGRLVTRDAGRTGLLTLNRGNAAGIYGQSVFVHVPSQVVVAKLSSWPAALSTPMRRATIAAVTAIASALSDG